MASRGGFGTVVKLLVLGVLLYFGYTQGLPWVKRQLNSGGAGTGSGEATTGEDGGRCVQLANQASDALSGEITRFARPPVDLDAWEGVHSQVEGQIFDGRLACGCALESCRKGSQALDELANLVAAWDSGFRGGQPPLNPGRQQEEIIQLLAEAQNLARQGK